MNYRHSFHAGNFADVHKHVVLLALLDRLMEKPAPLFFLDTHAGRGHYDLRADEAERGNEWRHGIGRLWQAGGVAPELQRYMQLVREYQPSANALQCYPGSPLFAARVLREGDRRVLVEKHPEEAQALRTSLRNKRAASIVEDDAYHALRTYLPPKENRGLALIDPPYEAADEFKRLQQALIFAAGRWPNGVYCAWYPLKGGGEEALSRTLKDSGLRKLLRCELWVRPVDSPMGLSGSGLILLNPPWKFAERLTAICRELSPLLASEGRGGFRVDWLAGE